MQEKSNFEKALKQFSDAHKLSLKSFDKTLMAEITVRLGVIHGILSDFDISLDYFLKALEIIKKTGDHQSHFNLLLNMGVMYHRITKKDLSFEKYTLNHFRLNFLKT